MMINRRELRRRDFILGVGAAAGAASFGPKGPGAMRTAMAADEVLWWATHFGDDTSSSRAVIRNDGGIANMPSSATTGLISANLLTATDNNTIGCRINSGPANNNLACSTIPGRGIEYSFHRHGMNLYIYGSIPANCNGQKTTIATAFFTLINGYHNAIVSWDSANSTINFMVDGYSITPSIVNYNGIPEPLNWSGAQTDIYANGDVADIGVFAGGVFLNPANVVDGFFDVERGYSPRNASNGHGIITGRNPQVWLSGPPSRIKLNHTSTTFTWPATMNPTSPSSDFYLASGSLAEATSDPFEPGSPI